VSLPCDWVRDNAPALVRGASPPPDVALHIAECVGCRAVTEGATALRADLDGWVAPEPPADLIERSLARMAMGGGDSAPISAPISESISESISAPELTVHRRRRTSVEILTGTPVAGGEGAAAPRGRSLLWRLVGQAAAAALLFTVCTTFVAVFYPAVTLALEDRRTHSCQVQLSRLAKGAVQYHREHPEGLAMQGNQLRRALEAGGYCDAKDFVCPGKSGRQLRERSYSGRIPAGSETLAVDEPLFLDRFTNHSSGFNVVYPTGRAEIVTVDAFSVWLSRRPRPTID
jgi:hypothetical protein